MKKFLITLFVLSFAGTANVAAQGWLDALKKVATTAADEATGGKLTQYALVGSWNYSGPGVKFEGEDMLSNLGGAAVETTATSRLEKAYQMVGIKPGACAFTFAKDDTFSATMGKRTLTGTYEFDASTHVITLHFAKGKINLGSIPGRAYISGTELQLVFPVTNLVEMVTKLGSKISSLESITTLLAKYKNVYVGLAFDKQ